MKSRLFSIFLTVSALWMLLALAPFACAAAASLGALTNQPATKSAAGSKTNSVTATNTGPVELVIPLSVFELTAKPTKDPFFPLSTRQPVPATVVSNIPPAFSPGNFTLKGLSGSGLALINNRTFAVGETNEITTLAGKIKVWLVEIKPGSVVIRAQGQPEPLEIFLRKAAQ